MRFGLCQIDSQWENRAATRSRIHGLLDSWLGTADCLLFPEMVLSGFSMDTAATTLETDDHQFFAKIAVRFGAAVLYGGVEEGFNCIFLVTPAEPMTVVYRKRHLFTFGGESGPYTPGTGTGFVEIAGVRLGLGVCYDLRFAYHFWVEAEACDGYVLIASWPESRRDHWLTLLKARAIENQAFVLGVNRVGTDPKLAYSGDSAVFGPFGESLLECGRAEGIYCCDVDFQEATQIRSRYQFLKDRKA